MGPKENAILGISQKWMKDLEVTQSGLNIYIRQEEQSISIEKDKLDNVIELLKTIRDSE